MSFAYYEQTTIVEIFLSVSIVAAGLCYAKLSTCLSWKGNKKSKTFIYLFLLFLHIRKVMKNAFTGN